MSRLSHTRPLTNPIQGPALRTLTTVAVAALMLAAVAGPATAQVPDPGDMDRLATQTDALAEHAGGHATNASDDPQSYLANATTNDSFRTDAYDFTELWTCETADIVASPAYDLLHEAGICPELADAQAGEDEAGDDAPELADNRTVAEAEELGNDTATAVEDEAAAVDEFLTNVTEEPTGAVGHLELFLNRTRVFLERLWDVPMFVVDKAVDAFDAVRHFAADTLVGVGKTVGGAVGDAIIDVAETVRDGAQGVVSWTGDGIGAIATGIGNVVGAVGDGVLAIGSATGDGVEATADATVGAIKGTGTAVTELAKGTASLVGEAVDHIKRILPGGGDGPAAGLDGNQLLDRARDPARGLTDGLGLPVDL